MKKLMLFICLMGLMSFSSNAQVDKKKSKTSRGVIRTNDEDVKTDAQYRRDHLQNWEEPKVNYTDTAVKHPSLIAPAK